MNLANLFWMLWIKYCEKKQLFEQKNQQAGEKIKTFLTVKVFAI